jgi:hypothetical protein
LSTPAQDLGPEWALLERIAVDAPDRSHPADLAQRPGFRWGEFVEQALRHQMLPMAAVELLEGDPPIPLPPHIRALLVEALDVNRERNRVLRAEAGRLSAALHRAGVPHAFTKGIALESTVYAGRGGRLLKDVDVMVAPTDLSRGADVLRSLGLTPGDVDPVSGRIVPLPREHHVRLRLHPDHLPRHARLTAHPVVRWVYVDVACSLTWHGSAWQVPVEPVLARALSLRLPDGPTIPVLAPPDCLTFVALHLFREAWLGQWVELGLDVTLAKFADVVRLCRAHRDALVGGALVRLLEGLGVVEPVAWVFQHLDRALSLDLSRDLALAARASPDFLAAAQRSSAGERRWDGDMRRRLHARDRARLFGTGDGP